MAATLFAARAWLGRWSQSGERFPVGSLERVVIDDAHLQSLVYYESEHSVGREFMRLAIRDAYGERYPVRVPTDDNEFAIQGTQGRALFRLDLVEPGEYEIRCDNPYYASDAEVPATDRVVFFKAPNTLDEALLIRRLILAGGGTVTIMLTLLLYVPHTVTLMRRSREDAGERPGP